SIPIKIFGLASTKSSNLITCRVTEREASSLCTAAFAILI
ncbi:unnamed protein product, partial [Allacma fusca]